MFSEGDEEFQSAKINNCGIVQFFDKIIVTKDKINLFKKWKEERLIVINDKKEENERINKELSNVEIYSIGRGLNDYYLKDILTLWQ